MDVLLIRPNDSKAVYSGVLNNIACEPPFWAMVIASYCRDRGIEVTILDAEAENMSPSSVVDRVKEISPRLIIVTVTGNNLSASTWKMNGAILCVKEIKKYMVVPVVMWGLHPSALPNDTMKETSADFLIKGEGLDSIVQLFSNLNITEKYASIDGLYYKKTNGDIVGNDRLNLVDGKDIPEPAWDLVDMGRYHAHNWQKFGEEEEGNYAVIATSLGCPFQCSFCAVSTLFGNKCVRYIQPRKVIEIIDNLVSRYNIKYIKILDENFVLNIKHVEEICDLLIERKYNLNIWAYARIDTVDKRILNKLKKAGIKWLAYGIESASELSLNGVSKGQYDIKKIKDIVKHTQKAGINVLANFMFGLPEDTKETMMKTLNFAKEINPEFINFYCTMAYPGSKLYSDMKKNGKKVPDDWLAYSQFSYECEPLPTKYLSSKDVLKFRDYAFEEFFRENKRYYDMINDKFGKDTINQINNMLEKKLKRKILE